MTNLELAREKLDELELEYCRAVIESNNANYQWIRE